MFLSKCGFAPGPGQSPPHHPCLSLNLVTSSELDFCLTLGFLKLALSSQVLQILTHWEAHLALEVFHRELHTLSGIDLLQWEVSI